MKIKSIFGRRNSKTVTDTGKGRRACPRKGGHHKGEIAIVSLIIFGM